MSVTGTSNNQPTNSGPAVSVITVIVSRGQTCHSLLFVCIYFALLVIHMPSFIFCVQSHGTSVDLGVFLCCVDLHKYVLGRK